jgi:hypothetical protein
MKKYLQIVKAAIVAVFSGDSTRQQQGIVFFVIFVPAATAFVTFAYICCNGIR